MLSVLIPLKDWDPSELVRSLADQLAQSGVAYEIIISDDSDPKTSPALAAELNKISGVQVFTREKPLGRSANRNFLASRASRDYLLFIDGDAGMSHPDFISRYLATLAPNKVLCGGTLYSQDPPENQEFMLRWKYGKAREQKSAAKRSVKPWKSFSTFNFLVPAGVFKKIEFNESVSGYGHEDTLFGMQMHQNGFDIEHIDNGLIHLGLEPSVNYLEKIRESAASLRDLHEKKAFPPGMERDISLLLTWKRLKKSGLSGLVSAWFEIRRKSLEKRLCGTNPSLLLLDLYKLGSVSSIG